MKKIKKPGSLNGFGIGVVIVLAVVMIVHVYLLLPDEPFYMRIVYGALSCGFVIIGAGLLGLIAFAIFYVSMKIHDTLFILNEEDENPLGTFEKLFDIISIALFIASYIIVFIHYK